jgi:hypothetical protein
MALHDNGKSAGKTGAGWSETDAVGAEFFGAGVNMGNTPAVATFSSRSTFRVGGTASHRILAHAWPRLLRRQIRSTD